MTEFVLTEDCMRLISEFESLTGASSRDCVIDERNSRIIFVVNPGEMGLAIGKKGQNVRLAAKLTGWKIDIKSEEEKRKEVEAELGALEAGAGDEAAGGDEAAAEAGEMFAHQRLAFAAAQFGETPVDVEAGDLPSSAGTDEQQPPDAAADRHKQRKGQEMQQPEQRGQGVTVETAEHD